MIQEIEMSQLLNILGETKIRRSLGCGSLLVREAN